MSNHGLHNLLNDNLQRFFTNSSDVSLNFLREWVNDPIFVSLEIGNGNGTGIGTQTENENIIVEEDADSIPDLIDPERVENPVTEQNRGLELWGNLLEDYHSQMRLYQENVRTILDITQHLLPMNRDRDRPTTRTRTNNNNNTNFLRDFLRNNTYTLDIERILPSLFTNNTSNTPPTQNDILYATTILNYDISNNELRSNICPISLEEFRDGESITRINHCGHVFKSTELSRWFIRNAHCPTCRYDIRHNG